MSDLIVLPLKPKGFDVEEVNRQTQLILNRKIVEQILEDPAANIKTNVLEGATLDDYKKYLRSFRTTIWAHKSISSEKGLEEAAEWLQATVNGLIRFINHGSEAL